MDIHRCRFVPYPTSTINVLAFSHSRNSREKGTSDLRLAIGRANGNIEIWNPMNGAWLQDTIFRGGRDRSVDGLVWTQDPDENDASGKIITGKLRLFSIGYTTTVTEWDLEKGQPLRQSSGNHGEIWCLAAQPPVSLGQEYPNSNSAAEQWPGQKLVTGCTDGAVVLYSTEDQDLKLQRVLVRPSSKKAKVISVIFQYRNIVIAGCTDSTIRIYDIRMGTLIRSMSLGAGPIGAPKETIIWAVKCLPNGNVISGDSSGEMRIWDGKTYTLSQRLKCHRQDILSLATSIDGSIIFSGGMDRRTVVYKLIGGKNSRWGEVTHRRFHGHDVKTMATFEGGGMSVIASGGPDGSPIVLPLREFGVENQRKLPCLPQEPAVQSAPKKRLLMSWWDREVHIWRIKQTTKLQHESSGFDSDYEGHNHQQKLVAKVLVKGEANITSASITSDGSLLAVSTAAEIKIFSLNSRESDGFNALRITKLDIPARLSVRGARLIQFSPNRHWLVVVLGDNLIVTARVIDFGDGSFRVIPMLSELVRIDREKEKWVLRGGLGAYDRTITRIAFSSDSRVLAVSDLDGYIDTWVLKGRENLAETGNNDNTAGDASLPSSDLSDSGSEQERKPIVMLGQHWIRNPSASLLPKLPSPAVILSFRPSVPETEKSPNRNGLYQPSRDLPQTEDRLVVVTAIHDVMEFNVLQGTMSEWSRRNPISKFPEEFKRLRDQAMGCVWDISDSKERLWLYGSSWMWMFDLSQDLGVNAPAQKSLTSGHVNASKTGRLKSPSNKRRKMNSGSKFKVDSKERAICGAGSRIRDSELAIGISRMHQSIIYETEGDLKEHIVDHHRRLSDVDLDDIDRQRGGGIDLALKRFRRGEGAALTDCDEQLAETGDGDTNNSICWWHTYKYRPIMGLAPIDGAAGLEVVLVERPAWEMDLPPRYSGDQDWEKHGV